MSLWPSLCLLHYSQQCSLHHGLYSAGSPFWTIIAFRLDVQGQKNTRRNRKGKKKSKMGSCLLVVGIWQGWPRMWSCPRLCQKSNYIPLPITTPTATPALILASVSTLREGRHRKLKEIHHRLYFLKDPTFQDTYRKRNDNCKIKTSSTFIMMSQF